METLVHGIVCFTWLCWHLFSCILHLLISRSLTCHSHDDMMAHLKEDMARLLAKAEYDPEDGTLKSLEMEKLTSKLLVEAE